MQTVEQDWPCFAIRATDSVTVIVIAGATETIILGALKISYIAAQLRRCRIPIQNSIIKYYRFIVFSDWARNSKSDCDK